MCQKGKDIFLFDHLVKGCQNANGRVELSVEAFNSSSRYLSDLLNIDNTFFDSMVNRLHPSELQLN